MDDFYTVTVGIRSAAAPVLFCDNCREGAIRGAA